MIIFLEDLSKFCFAVYDFLEENQKNPNYSDLAERLNKISEEAFLTGKKEAKAFLKEICQGKHKKFLENLEPYLLAFYKRALVKSFDFY